MVNQNKLEKLLWSIALPGFGQILNGHQIKGVLFIALEILINNKSNLNKIIIYSFRGDVNNAIVETNYSWLMFYPCIYMFAIWDAYKNAKGENSLFSFLPFVIAAYMGTLGVIYSTDFRIFGFLLGPVWLPILFLIAGSILGNLISRIIRDLFGGIHN